MHNILKYLHFENLKESGLQNNYQVLEQVM